MVKCEDEVLRVVGARKTYGDTDALRGVDLVLRKKEWLALIGPNGAGKTTLVRAVAGRVGLDGGDIYIGGVDVNENGGSLNGDGRRGRDLLGLVPQEIALFPLLTARENLEAFGKFHGIEGGEVVERAKWALAWTELEGHSEREVRTFSGGMKRRLNLACGVLHGPEILLLDEPTEGVDPQSRERIWEMLETLRGEGASLLHTTHHLNEAEEVCDSLVIIDHGKVAAAGTIDEVIGETIGRKRRVRLVLDRDVDDRLLSHDDYSFCVDEGRANVIYCDIEEFTTGVPDIYGIVCGGGYEVRDMHVEHPTLQAVFLKLTGRELREGA